MGEKVEKRFFGGEPIKFMTNYVVISADDGNWPIKGIGQHLLDIPGVFEVNTWEWPRDDDDSSFHGEIWVYCMEWNKKSDLMNVLHQFGYKQVQMYNDLYKTGKRRFKFTLSGKIGTKEA